MVRGANLAPIRRGKGLKGLSQKPLDIKRLASLPPKKQA